MSAENAGFPTFESKAARLVFFKEKLARNAAWAMRACEVIYAHQTESEKDARITVEDNGVGFSGRDAEILSSFAEQIITNRAARKAGTFPKHYGLLSPKQTSILHKLMPKYAAQLIEHLEASGTLPALVKPVSAGAGAVAAAA